nr:MAG TPA: Integrase [Caudoviricetes sp.]
MNANFMTYMKSRQFSSNTMENYIRHINQFMNYIGKDETDITPFDIMNWIGEIGQVNTASSVHTKLESVKSYFEFLYNFGFINSNPAEKIESPKFYNKPKNYMNLNMIQDMVKACKSNRDKAIILTLAFTGMRVSELTALTIDNYMAMKQRGDNQILIVGKGAKKRYIVFNNQVQASIDYYIKTWTAPRNCDKLFLSMWGNEIARNNLNMTLKSIAKEAGIPFWEEISPHALRSACASIYSEAGMPVANIRDMLGHSNIKTTSLYVKSSLQNTTNIVMNMNISI